MKDSLTRKSHKTAENLKENNNFSNVAHLKVKESEIEKQSIDQVSVVLSKHIN